MSKTRSRRYTKADPPDGVIVSKALADRLFQDENGNYVYGYPRKGKLSKGSLRVVEEPCALCGTRRLIIRRRKHKGKLNKCPNCIDPEWLEEHLKRHTLPKNLSFMGRSDPHSLIYYETVNGKLLRLATLLKGRKCRVVYREVACLSCTRPYLVREKYGRTLHADCCQRCAKKKAREEIRAKVAVVDEVSKYTGRPERTRAIGSALDILRPFGPASGSKIITLPGPTGDTDLSRIANRIFQVDLAMLYELPVEAVEPKLRSRQKQLITAQRLSIPYLEEEHLCKVEHYVGDVLRSRHEDVDFANLDFCRAWGPDLFPRLEEFIRANAPKESGRMCLLLNLSVRGKGNSKENYIKRFAGWREKLGKRRPIEVLTMEHFPYGAQPTMFLTAVAVQVNRK